MTTEPTIIDDALLAHALRSDAQTACFASALAWLAGKGGLPGLLDDALVDMTDAAGLDGGAEDS